MVTTRSQTRKSGAKIDHVNLSRMPCSLCGALHDDSEVAAFRPLSSWRTQLDECVLSLVTYYRNLEATTLHLEQASEGTKPRAEVPSSSKEKVFLKLWEHEIRHQKAMRPSKDTKLLLRKRKPRDTTEKRRRRHFPSVTHLANHLKSRRTIRLMRSLKLPILPSENTPANLGEYLKHLRWKITLKPPPPRPIFHHPNDETTPRGTPTSDSIAAAELVPRFTTTLRDMRLPPLAPRHDPLKKERLRLEERFRGSSFQISTTWRPLCHIHRSELHNRRQGTLDSELREDSVSVTATTGESSESSISSSRTVMPPRSPLPEAPYADTLLKFTSSQWGSFPLVNEREVLVAMRPLQLSWTYQDEAGSIVRAKRHAGIFGFCEARAGGNTIASRAITRLLILRDDDSIQWKEAGFRLKVARLFADIWSREIMPAYCSFQVSCFITSGRTAPLRTTLDVACLPLDTVLPSASQVMPVFLAAQYVTDSEQSAVEQLASAFHTTLMIMIVYYLDRRSRADEKLPSWMVLYGVIFDESGFRLQEFYPVYTGDGAGQPADIGWGASSDFVASSTIRIFTVHDVDRGRLIQVLLRLVSHAQDILQKLVQWDGYERLMVSLLLPVK